jgi:hypothetical protein
MRIKEPKVDRIEVRVSREERQMVVALARRDETTPADIVRRLVRCEYRRVERQESR